MGKKSKHVEPVAGSDFIREQNGVIVVGRPCPNPTLDYDNKLVIPNYLSLVDHDAEMSKKHYEKELDAAEKRFNELVRGEMNEQERNIIIVLQGRDGAGKTGTRKVIADALDNDDKIFQSYGFGPPEAHERRHHFLWRFFTGERMPRFDQVRVFDRSWAEQLLVVPVMKLDSEENVRVAYSQINTFEWSLVKGGTIVIKFWLDITKDEQKVRFDEREKNKKWKLSPSDGEARAHWDDYTVAANEMFHRTGTEYCPWHIVSSEDKRYCRVTVLQTINNALTKALKAKKK